MTFANQIQNGLNKKILIVDDNPGYLEFIRSVLQDDGYETAEVEDGAHVVSQATTFQPDLILLDHYLPDTTGLEVCKELKQNPSLKEIPVIFLSGQSDPHEKIEGLDQGGADYINKVSSIDEILVRIRNQLKIRSLTQQVLRANKELTEKQKRIDESLNSASEVQKTLLPKPNHLPNWPEFKFVWIFEPCDPVGGDIFNILQLNDDLLALYMVDVSGHGLPSSLLTVSVSQSLHPLHGKSLTRNNSDASVGYNSPAQVLRFLDQEYPYERFGTYFSIAYLLINRKTGQFSSSVAAHPPPVLQPQMGPLKILHAGGPIIGFGAHGGFEEERHPLKTGDRLWIYTDGVIEVQNSKGEFFGQKRLYDLLVETKTKSLQDAVSTLKLELKQFKENHPSRDDLTLIGMEYLK